MEEVTVATAKPPFDFSTALFLIKRGYKMSRGAWQNRSVFIYLVDGSKFKVNRAPLNAMYEMGTEITYRPHIDICAADGTCGVWSPSNEDLLAEDWTNV